MLKTLRRSGGRPCLGALLLWAGLLYGGTAGSQVEPAEQPRAGLFLVASPDIADPRFAETVILLVEHSQQGSHGLIINRRTSTTASEFFPDFDIAATAQHLIHVGGPVALGHFAFLYRIGERHAEGKAVIDDVYFHNDIVLLERLMAMAGTPLRIFLGYAGWAPGQLQWELQRGDWELTNARADDVFRDSIDGLWRELSRHRRGVLAAR